jgi:tetratricopeptide (TPR) repeat protein
MSNRTQDHVHRLILSMTRAEKRYFKLFTGRNSNLGHNNHTVLFDAIAAMEHYDEQAVMDQFKGEAFTHRFAITKRRLYEAILRSLDAFHAESSVDARLGRMIHQLEILHDRSLYEDAAKMLLSITKLARQHDRQGALVAALEWERRLGERDNYVHIGPDELDELCMNSQALNDELAELHELWSLKSRLFMTLYRKGQVRDEQMRRDVEALLAHPVLQGTAAPRSAKAGFLRHHIRSAAAFAIGDLGTCFDHLKANLLALQQERERFLNEPNLVLSVLSNLAFVSVALGRYTESFAYLKAFRNTPAEWNMAENEDLDLKLFSTSYSLELGIHTRMGRVDLALELAPAVERGLERYGDRLGPVRKAGFQYQLAYARFLAGHTDEALRWANKLLDGLRTEDSSDLAVAGRTLYLALLLEANKKDLLPYALRNTERFLQNRDRMHRFEPLFMTLLRASLRTRNMDELRSVFTTFRDALMPLADDPLERGVFDQFDALSWAESKATGRPLNEVVMDRAARTGQAA